MTDRLVRPAKVKTPDNDLGDAAVVYLDDVCIAANEFEILLQRTRALFNRIRAGRFKLKAKKCFRLKVQFLGFQLSEKGLHADPEKVEAIIHCPSPQRFLKSSSSLD